VLDLFFRASVIAMGFTAVILGAVLIMIGVEGG